MVGNFTIVQNTDGSAIMTIVPSDATIKGAFKGVCSTGFATDYYIYGGTPPYRVTSTFPNSIILVNSVVNTNGGFFRAITNGSCVDPLTFSILDATGRQTTATLHNVEGTEDVPVVTPAALAVAPASYTDAACTGKTFTFVVFGGTPPYNVSPTSGTASPQTVTTNGGSTSVSGLLTGSGPRPSWSWIRARRRRAPPRRSPARRDWPARRAGPGVHPACCDTRRRRVAAANEPTRRAPRAGPATRRRP